jgi:photosystem II stability/assembly factor-like uncharacterized protein
LDVRLPISSLAVILMAGLGPEPLLFAADEEEDEGSAIVERTRLELASRGGAVSVASIAREYAARRAAQRQSVRALALSDTIWTPLGPSSAPGRMSALAPHPSTSGTLYAGAAGGGVFRTTDGGGTWTPLTDDLPNLAIGAIALAPSAPSTIYVGTGEGGPSGAFVPGIGLVRSTDGGATWSVPSAAVASQFFRISVHPSNALDLVAATSAGGLRSTDGGATFATVISPSVYGAVSDLVRDPATPQTLYAASWCASGGCAHGPARILKSTDDGATWVEKSAGIAFDGNAGEARASLAISRSNPSVLYAARAAGGVSHVYRTGDGAGSWTELVAVSSNPDASIRGYMGAQSWYDNVLAVSPADPDTVFAAGIYTIRSTDGGRSFRHPALAGTVVHLDVHDLQFQDGALWIATDGGVFHTPDAGDTAVSANAGLVTRQYYAVAQQPGALDRVLAGAQDNGTDQGVSGAWRTALGGDGFDSGFDATAPGTAWATCEYGRVFRTDASGGAGAFQEVTPHWADLGEEPPFKTVLVADPSRSGHLVTGASRVFESVDGGGSWTPLSTNTPGSTWSAEAITALALSRTPSRVVLAAKGSALFASTDGGTSWMDAGGGLPGTRINGLEIDPKDPSVAWAALASTDGSSVYQTTNGGRWWMPRSSGLPPFATYSVKTDPRDSIVLYAGTDVGIYRSTDAGSSWTRFGTGLPAVAVRAIAPSPDGTLLRVATYGRGLYEAHLAPLPASAPPPSAPPSWLVAGMAYSNGAGGTFWQSDLSIFNPDPTRPMSLSLAFLDGQGPGTAPVFHAITVAPLETKTFVNVLASAPFSLPRGSYGALLVRGDATPVPPVLSGRTYNAGTGSGTFGLSVPAVPVPSSGIAPQATDAGSLTLIGLRELPGTAHTNLVLANLSGGAATASISFLDGHGAALGARVDVSVPAFGVRQLNRVLSAAPPDGAGVAVPAAPYTAMVNVTSGSIFPYATVIDDVTSDPIVISPPSRAASTVRLPGIVRTRGRNGTIFLSDVVVHNPTDATRNLTLSYSYQSSDAAGRRTAAKSVTLGPRETLEIDDFVARWLGVNDPAASVAYASSYLDVSASDGQPVLALGLTYDAPATGGRVGFQVPAYTPLDAAGASGAGHRLVMAGLASGSATRTNVALFLAGPGAASGTLTVVDASGHLVSSRAVSLSSDAPFLQVNDADLFGGRALPGLSIVVDGLSGTAPVAGYATLIDNLSGDAILVQAAPGN